MLISGVKATYSPRRLAQLQHSASANGAFVLVPSSLVRLQGEPTSRKILGMKILTLVTGARARYLGIVSDFG